MICRAVLLALCATLAARAAGQDREPAAPAPSRDIIVTGVRLKDSEAVLRACIARKCPPDQDINATIGHAENLFIAGDYHAARRTLKSGVGRNWRYAHQYPVLVADLMRSNSRVAAHLGENDDTLFSANAVVRALKAGLPADDYRVLVARIEVGDDYARSRRSDEGLAIYKEVAAQAHRLGYSAVEGYARLRTAILLGLLGDAGDSGAREMARRAIDALIAEPDPKLAAFAFAGRVLKAQAAARKGDSTAIDALIADYRRIAKASPRPMLLFGPPINMDPTRGARPTSDHFDDQWVDISYWIAPDGRVTDADILRQGKGFTGDWAKPILAAIGARRYAPLAMDGAQPGVLRIERYSYTAHWTVSSTSHIRKRESTPVIEMLDLTVDPPAMAQDSAK
jgi:hypothetical protein